MATVGWIHSPSAVIGGIAAACSKAESNAIAPLAVELGQAKKTREKQNLDHKQ